MGGGGLQIEPNESGEKAVEVCGTYTSHSSSKAYGKSMLLFKKRLDQERDISVDGPRLVSLHIPPEKPIGEVLSLLQDHLAKIDVNVSETSQSVKVALTSMLTQLNSLDHSVPAHGLVLLCGEVEGRLHRQLLEPPLPVPEFVFRNDDRFYLDPLYQMTEAEGTYGILVMDLSEATIGFASGASITRFVHLRSQVPNNHHHGGMSSLRFERLRDDAINEYFKKVAERCAKAFLGRELKGIIVGGPALTKNDFLAGEYLHYELRKQLIGVVDIKSTGEQGLQEAKDVSEGLMANCEYLHDRMVLDHFFTELGKGGLVVIGLDPTLELLRRGQIDTVIVSDRLDLASIEEIMGVSEEQHTEMMLLGQESELGRHFAPVAKLGGVLRYK